MVLTSLLSDGRKDGGDMLDLAPFVDAIKGRHFGVVIWASADLRDFLFLDVDAPVKDFTELFAHPKFIGTVALDDEGKPHSAVTEPLDAEALEAVVSAYVRHVESNFRSVLKMPMPAAS
jgi:hypothetical protein